MPFSATENHSNSLQRSQAPPDGRSRGTSGNNFDPVAIASQERGKSRLDNLYAKCERLLARAEKKGDLAAALELSRQLGRLHKLIEAQAAREPKKSTGDGLIASHKNSWKLCDQCRVLEILGYYKLPETGKEAYVTKLCQYLMNWAETESEREKPRMELLACAGVLCGELLGREWPLEYEAPVHTFIEAMRGNANVGNFAAALRGLKNEEKP